MFCNLLPPLIKKKKNLRTLTHFNLLKSYSTMAFLMYLRNFAFHKADNFLTIQKVSSVKWRSYVMEFWTSMYNMVSLQFPRDMKVGLPFTALSRDDSLECTALYTTIRFIVERSSSTWCHKAQYTGRTTLSLLRLAVPTKPALHPQHVNPYPTAFPYGNGMVLHFYQQQESSTTKTVHKVINKGLKTYV